MINALRINCPLNCGWTGSLGDLQGHKDNHCPLHPMECKHCYKSFTRFQLTVHETIGCPKQKIACSKCEMPMIRENMNGHNAACPQKWLIDKGTMINEHREIVSNALQYCYQQTTLTKIDIRDRLKTQGMKAMVIKGNLDAAWEHSKTTFCCSISIFPEFVHAISLLLIDRYCTIMMLYIPYFVDFH